MAVEETEGMTEVNDNDFHQKQSGEGVPEVPPPVSQKTKGKSCKGCLYYSTALKSDSRNPLCVGITRSLPHVPRYIVGESEVEATKRGRNLTDFKYGCIGYSIYPDSKDRAADTQKSKTGSPDSDGCSADSTQETKTELPVCVGLEILADRRTVSTDSSAMHTHNKEDATTISPSGSRKPAHSFGDEFFNRFTRNAGLVAGGVVKNLQKVGNRIKETVDDILFPYRRRPK